MRWLVAASIILCLALWTGLGLLAYAMYVLVGLLIASRVLARRWIESVHAERECNRLTANVGDKLAVSVVIRNNGKLPIPWVLLEDVLPRLALIQRPPRIRVEGKRLLVGALAPGSTKTLRYQVHFEMRGYYQIGPAVLETGDLFGLHRRWRVGSEPHFVLVYPRLMPLEGYDLASRRPLGEIRLTHRLFEDPTRIAGVRYYQAGDSLNRVNWRATARTGTLHSKVYEPSSIAGATILLDLHQAAYPAVNEPIRSELAITAAASLANAVYLTRQQVGLATNGRDAVDRIKQEGWETDYRTRDRARQAAGMLATSDRLQPVTVPTRRGPEQLIRILETLARVELTDGLTFEQLCTEMASRLPRDATVIAVLPDVTEETSWILASLRRRGYAVTAILISFGEDHALTCRGRLVRQGIDVRLVHDEASLTAVCQQHGLR